jgi:hypothetical protein
MAPQSNGVKNGKKKPPNISKADFQTSKKFLICCSVDITVPR